MNYFLELVFHVLLFEQILFFIFAKKKKNDAVIMAVVEYILEMLYQSTRDVILNYIVNRVTHT